MNYVICAIQDRSVGAFLNVHCARAEGQAIRGFMDAIANPANTDIHNHADDFDLYVVAIFDDTTGLVTPEPQPRKIADGKQLKIKGE